MQQLYSFKVSWLLRSSFRRLKWHMSPFFMLSKIAGSAGLSGAIGKCFGCDYEARRGRSKGQISDIHRKSEKAREGAHLHTHLCVRYWMTGLIFPVTLLWASSKHHWLDFTLLSLLSCSRSLSFISGSRSILPLEDDQSRADRSEITPCGAEREILADYLSSWKI